MHRNFRCFLLLLTTTGAVLTTFGVSTNPVFAQDAPASDSRLLVHLRLGDGHHTWRPSRRQIGVTYATGGDKSSLGEFTFKVNRAKLRRYLNHIAPYVQREPKDAHPVVSHADPKDMGEDEVPAKIIPGYDGAALEVDAAVDAVQKSLETKPSVVHIILPVKTKKAKVSAEDLKGINARIGYFVTRFQAGNVGRTQTVRLAVNIIDGTVVPPGGIFSVNKVVGERTPQRGFGKSDVFINGHMEVQTGGGMCQVATTLFNASMLANLKIVERHQHVRTIMYADPGRDATVYYGEKDFRFQNDTDAPVYVSYKTTYSHAIVSLFGKATPGLKVKLVSHHRRLAERHFTGTFYRVSYEPGKPPQKSQVFYSDYKWTPSLDYNR